MKCQRLHFHSHGIRGCSQFPPSPSHLPTDSAYSSQPSWLWGTGGAEISTQIYAMAGIWTV